MYDVLKLAGLEAGLGPWEVYGLVHIEKIRSHRHN